MLDCKLKIIGTMNTADRTIGQIDYAVRRRFAFVHCPPDVTVVENPSAAFRALEFFKMVEQRKFETDLSADHDKEDVCIGHSYFLADGVPQLANKIIYQVVPILREYLKDGVLMKEAEAKKFGKLRQKPVRYRITAPLFLHRPHRRNPQQVIRNGGGCIWNQASWQLRSPYVQNRLVAGASLRQHGQISKISGSDSAESRLFICTVPAYR